MVAQYLETIAVAVHKLNRNAQLRPNSFKVRPYKSTALSCAKSWQWDLNETCDKHMENIFLCFVRLKNGLYSTCYCL